MFDILDRVKDNIDIDDASQDDVLTRLIEAAQKDIEKYCDQPVEATIVYLKSIELDENGNVIIPYVEVPVEVNSIKYQKHFESTVYTIDPDDYEVVVENETRLINYRYTWDKDVKYTIELLVGWTNDIIPEDIYNVAEEMVVWKYKKRTRDKDILGMKSVSDSFSGLSGSISFDEKQLIKDWQRRLSPYKAWIT